jgi:DNA-binding transcriptional ArsR family regulator
MSQSERDAVFRALGDPTRRLLLERLSQHNGQSLVQLACGLDITRQATTKHLVVLEEAGLVLTRKQGRTRLHFLNPVPLHAEAQRWLRQFDTLRLDILASARPPAA